MTPSDTGNTPANMNRYFSRSVDMDIVAVSPTRGFVYAKLCRLLIVGFINMSENHGFEGTRLEYGEIRIDTMNYVLPAQFGQYMMNKAQRMWELQTNLSPGQKQKSELKMKKAADKIANSANFEAMMHDVDVFGDAAFIDDIDSNS